MSQSWEELVGNFTQLNTGSISNKITSCIYTTMLKERELMLNEINNSVDEYVDIHNQFLSFSEEEATRNAPDPKNKPKHTFMTQIPKTEEVEVDGKKKKVALKDSEGKVITELGAKAKSKWITMTQDLKYALSFVILRYTKEFNDFYVENGNSFPTNLEQSVIEKYRDGDNNFHSCISPFILRVTSKFNIDHIPENYEKIDEFLKSKFDTVFIGSSSASIPEVEFINKRFVIFIKLIACTLARHNWFVKKQGNQQLLLTVFNLLNVFSGDIKISAGFINQLTDYTKERHDMAQQAKLQKETDTTASPELEDFNFETNTEDILNEMFDNDDDWAESVMDDDF